MEKEFIIDNEASFEIETLQDWSLEAGANQVVVDAGGSCCNCNSNNAGAV